MTGKKHENIFQFSTLQILDRVEGGFGGWFPDTLPAPVPFPFSSQFLPLFTQSRKFEGLVCACSVISVVLTLCDPMNHSPPGSTVHGISRARILEWVAMPSSRDLPNPRIKPHLLQLLHCRQNLYHWATREAFQGLLLIFIKSGFH